MIEAYKAEIEKLLKKLDQLKEENARLRKMVIALDNGLTITSDGLTYKDGEFKNE